MAAPDLNSPTKVEGKLARVAVGTAATTVVSNGTASSACLRVVSLMVANVDGASAADVTCDVTDGTAAFHICKTVSVPADATLEIVSQRPLYLEEGHTLRLTASAASDLEAVVSYERIT